MQHVADDCSNNSDSANGVNSGQRWRKTVSDPNPISARSGRHASSVEASDGEGMAGLGPLKPKTNGSGYRHEEDNNEGEAGPLASATTTTVEALEGQAAAMMATIESLLSVVQSGADERDALAGALRAAQERIQTLLLAAAAVPDSDEDEDAAVYGVEGGDDRQRIAGGVGRGGGHEGGNSPQRQRAAARAGVHAHTATGSMGASGGHDHLAEYGLGGDDGVVVGDASSSPYDHDDAGAHVDYDGTYGHAEDNEGDTFLVSTTGSPSHSAAAASAAAAGAAALPPRRVRTIGCNTIFTGDASSRALVPMTVVRGGPIDQRGGAAAAAAAVPSGASDGGGSTAGRGPFAPNTLRKLGDSGLPNGKMVPRGIGYKSPYRRSALMTQPAASIAAAAVGANARAAAGGTSPQRSRSRVANGNASPPSAAAGVGFRARPVPASTYSAEGGPLAITNTVTNIIPGGGRGAPAPAPPMSLHRSLSISGGGRQNPAGHSQSQGSPHHFDAFGSPQQQQQQHVNVSYVTNTVVTTRYRRMYDFERLEPHIKDHMLTLELENKRLKKEVQTLAREGRRRESELEQRQVVLGKRIAHAEDFAQRCTAQVAELEVELKATKLKYQEVRTLLQRMVVSSQQQQQQQITGGSVGGSLSQQAIAYYAYQPSSLSQHQPFAAEPSHTYGRSNGAANASLYRTHSTASSAAYGQYSSQQALRSRSGGNYQQQQQQQQRRASPSAASSSAGAQSYSNNNTTTRSNGNNTNNNTLNGLSLNGGIPSSASLLGAANAEGEGVSSRSAGGGRGGGGPTRSRSGGGGTYYSPSVRRPQAAVSVGRSASDSFSGDEAYGAIVAEAGSDAEEEEAAGVAPSAHPATSAEAVAGTSPTKRASAVAAVGGGGRRSGAWSVVRDDSRPLNEAQEAPRAHSHLEEEEERRDSNGSAADSTTEYIVDDAVAAAATANYASMRLGSSGSGGRSDSGGGGEAGSRRGASSRSPDRVPSAPTAYGAAASASAAGGAVFATPFVAEAGAEAEVEATAEEEAPPLLQVDDDAINAAVVNNIAFEEAVVVEDASALLPADVEDVVEAEMDSHPSYANNPPLPAEHAAGWGAAVDADAVEEARRGDDGYAYGGVEQAADDEDAELRVLSEERAVGEEEGEAAEYEVTPITTPIHELMEEY